MNIDFRVSPFVQTDENLLQDSLKPLSFHSVSTQIWDPSETMVWSPSYHFIKNSSLSTHSLCLPIKKWRDDYNLILRILLVNCLHINCRNSSKFSTNVSLVMTGENPGVCSHREKIYLSEFARLCLKCQDERLRYWDNCLADHSTKFVNTLSV